MWEREWMKEEGKMMEREGGEARFRATAGLFVWLGTASPILNLRLG